MRRPSLPTLAALGAGVVLVIGLIIQIVPWWTTSRDLVSSVPGPAPLSGFAPIQLRPGHTACATSVVIDTDAGRVDLIAKPGRHKGAPLRITASGPGYRSQAIAPGGLTGSVAYSARIQPPPRSLVGQVCAQNIGRRALRLQGNAEPRSNTAQQMTLDGKPNPFDLTMTIYQAGHPSYVSSFATLLDRAATLKFGFLRGWMLWPLALLVFFGVLLIPGWAVYRAFRADENIAA